MDAPSPFSEFLYELLPLLPTAILVGLGTASFILFTRFLAGRYEAPVPYHVGVPEQCLPGWKGEVLDEPDVKVPGFSAIQCYCPANGKSLGLVNPYTAAGIDRAIAKAKEAQREWKKTSFAQRRKVLRSMLKFILDNQEDIITAACLDSGKTRLDAVLGEILVTAEKLQWTIDHGDRALRTERRPTNFMMIYKRNEVRWEPLGVVAACVSWNYPFHNLFNGLISALFSGNAIVIKPSEATAWSSNYFTKIARGALTACGHDPQLVQTVVCWPSVAPHLTSHPDLSHLTFIGSRRVAHQVAAAASKSLTPLVLELGGKDPAVVLDDAGSIDRICDFLLRGVFQSAGQNCIGIERIIALPSVYVRLVDLLATKVRALRVGNALDPAKGSDAVDVGACVSDANFARLESLIESAVASGARLLAGGKRFDHPACPKGHYFSPTLLVGVTPDMEIAQEELFAPVMILMRASTVEDAISIANSTPYALGASVFGTNKADLDKVTREVNAGMVSVNDFAVYYTVSLPFGGVRGSGYGRFGGEEGLRGLCNLKSVCSDRWPGVRTSIPAGLGLPVKNEKRAVRMAEGIVEVGYASGSAWWKGLRKVVGI